MTGSSSSSSFSSSPLRRFANIFATFFQWTLGGQGNPAVLPQYDEPGKHGRLREIEKGREKYQWTHDSIADASRIKGLPLPEELPRVHWLFQLLRIVLNLRVNTRRSQAIIDNAEKVDEELDEVKKLAQQVADDSRKKRLTEQGAESALNAIASLVSSASAIGKGQSLEEYKELFKTIGLDKVTENDQFLGDDIFGWYRIAGPNPMRLRKLVNPAEKYPSVTDKMFRAVVGFEEDSLEVAAAEDRLYYLEYPEFDGINSPPAKRDRFVYAPRCILAVPRKGTSYRQKLLPIAVKCRAEDEYPWYTASQDHTHPVTWLAAKATVQITDAIVHETIYHLGRCHLLTEVFICATHRTLAPAHPLYRLLLVHFYGTALINWAAEKSLIQDGGVIDKITSTEISLARKVSANAVNSPDFHYNNWFPDVEMAERGVLNEILHFPYRDDALRIWKATLDWACCYVYAYYRTDHDVLSDFELQNWADEISAEDRGNLHGFGELEEENDGVPIKGRLQSREYLSRVVAMIIFTASAQHATVNFPQSTLMQFAPSMPLGGYAPAPKDQKPFDTIDQWVRDMLPPMQQAYDQLSTAQLIGVLQYSVLGEYKNELRDVPKEVRNGMREFQTKLREIGEQIEKRNAQELAENLPPYSFLLPKNIPQSINI